VHCVGLVLQVFQVFAGRGGSRLDPDELVAALKLAGTLQPYAWSPQCVDPVQLNAARDALHRFL
jgi:hypothetical protein